MMKPSRTFHSTNGKGYLEVGTLKCTSRFLASPRDTHTFCRFSIKKNCSGKASLSAFGKPMTVRVERNPSRWDQFLRPFIHFGCEELTLSGQIQPFWTLLERYSIWLTKPYLQSGAISTNRSHQPNSVCCTRTVHEMR